MGYFPMGHVCITAYFNGGSYQMPNLYREIIEHAVWH
jgi:hypothetical protein